MHFFINFNPEFINQHPNESSKSEKEGTMATAYAEDKRGIGYCFCTFLSGC
jgi:hypothetical protein